MVRANHQGPSMITGLNAARTQLDSVIPAEVIWDPYAGVEVPQDCAEFRYISLQRWPFIGPSIYEYYLGKWAWRQLMGDFRVPLLPPSPMFGRHDDFPPISPASSLLDDDADYFVYMSRFSIGRIIVVHGVVGDTHM